jgi:hypothetical protein
MTMRVTPLVVQRARYDEAIHVARRQVIEAPDAEARCAALAHLDTVYVGGAWLRLRDHEVIRLRRWLRHTRQAA